MDISHFAKQGLTNQEVQEGLMRFGYNVIKEHDRTSFWMLFFRQFSNNYVVYLLIVSALLSFFVGHPETAYTVLVVAIIIIGVGLIQEYKAEKAIQALKKMLLPMCVVVRNGVQQQVSTHTLVPGDCVVLMSGQKVPADCRVIKEEELRVNESLLTGESKDVQKFEYSDRDTPDSMVFMGTFVVNGRCFAQVVNTGMQTEFGKIASLISTATKELPLQKKINGIVTFMVIVALLSSFVTGIILFLRAPIVTSEVIVGILLTMIAFSVSSFPEGMPVVLITTLATGAYRMAKKNAIVTRMSIIETLGETTVICTDKTGTLTRGEMTATKLRTQSGGEISVTLDHHGQPGSIVGSSTQVDRLLEICSQCNDVFTEFEEANGAMILRGSPTERALFLLGKLGFSKSYQRLQTLPFNSTRKMMSVVVQDSTTRLVFTKGAPEYLLNCCSFTVQNGRVVQLTDSLANDILSQTSIYAGQSLRVLGLAYKQLSDGDSNYEQGLIFAGLVGLIDPVREEVKGSLLECKKAGIHVKMVTGDNPMTAQNCAQAIGLIGKMITGAELDTLTDVQLIQNIQSIAVFARVLPHHKLRIVEALKQMGHIVTMTGDGINDAPSLKEAHVGVAMGQTGTEVSHQSADLILKDDNFATIVEAIKEGRAIYKNVQRFVGYDLSCNGAEIITILIAILIGLPLPLLALQILFMNIVTDNIPALTLALTPSHSGIMLEKAGKHPKIITRALLLQLLIAAALMGAGSIGIFWRTLDVGAGIEVARTMALVVLILFELVNAFHFLSTTIPMSMLGIFHNKYLLGACCLSIIATLVILYSPLSSVFGTMPLTIQQWLLLMVIALMYALVCDVLKYLGVFAVTMNGRHLEKNI